jgi:TIGR03009 family protein
MRTLITLLTAVYLLGAQAALAQQPPFTLSDAEAKQLDAMLLAWQQKSQAIKYLEGDFQKWKFDIAAAPANQHSTWSRGTVKYMSPDRGLFKEDDIQFYSGADAEGKAIYKGDQRRFGEWWVCTGTDLIFMNREDKICRIEQLPPGMQGQQLFDSPLPFVFNLDAEKLKQRFWIRAIVPPDQRSDRYWIEAWPKTQKDAQLYKLVQVVLGSSDFLPQALIIYPPNFDAQKAPNRDIYEFVNVKVNHINALQAATAALFQQQFINPKPPAADWKIIREPAAVPDGQRTAQQPTAEATPQR